MEHAWAKDSKVAFKRDPFPVKALQSHIQRGTVSGPLWLHDAFLVALGLHTMQHTSKLCTLQTCNLTWLPEQQVLHVFIHSSKVDQASHGFEVFVKATEAPWCVVHLWRLHSTLQPPGRLFTVAHSGPFTTSTVTSICKRMVMDVGLNVTLSSHSLQIGGATTAMLASLQHKQIMAIGGWRSDAVDCYLRAFEVTQLGASQAILGAAL